MSRPGRGDRARSVAAVGSAALTLLAIALLASIWSPRTRAEAQSTDPWSGSRFTSPDNYGTSTDGVFTGVFKHTPYAPIASVNLAVDFSAGDTHPANCEPAPSTQTHTYETATTTSTTVDTATTEPPTTTTQPPPPSSQVEFSFDFTFRCNGTYDLVATARVEDQSGSTPGPLKKAITASAVRIATAPPSPTAFQAADNGNRTVTLSWSAPQSYGRAPGPPPDFQGYRVSRKDAGGGAFAEIGTTGPSGLTLTDSSIPPSGGSYIYQVETLRKFASSPPVTTVAPLVIAGPTPNSSAGGTGGASGGGTGRRGGSSAQDSGTSGGGATHFEEPTTLAADEGELGAADPLGGLPGGATIQRFGRSGAGLLKPFAAALDLGVWAGLLLFLTRRAAREERADRLFVELEHPA
jgi:hypothetical protein